MHITESDHAQLPRLQSTGNSSMNRAYDVTICLHTILVYDAITYLSWYTSTNIFYKDPHFTDSNESHSVWTSPDNGYQYDSARVELVDSLHFLLVQSRCPAILLDRPTAVLCHIAGSATSSLFSRNLLRS